MPACSGTPKESISHRSRTHNTPPGVGQALIGGWEVVVVVVDHTGADGQADMSVYDINTIAGVSARGGGDSTQFVSACTTFFSAVQLRLELKKTC